MYTLILQDYNEEGGRSAICIRWYSGKFVDISSFSKFEHLV
jgi:hypothetical protein